MIYIILARNPRNGRVIMVGNEDDDYPQATIYDTEDDAEEAAKNIPICGAWPYSVVEIP